MSAELTALRDDRDQAERESEAGDVHEDADAATRDEELHGSLIGRTPE